MKKKKKKEKEKKIKGLLKCQPQKYCDLVTQSSLTLVDH